MYLLNPDSLNSLKLVNKQLKESTVAQRYESHLLHVAYFSVHSGRFHAVTSFCLGCSLSFALGQG